MFAGIFDGFPYLDWIVSSPAALAFAVFQIWMILDAIRRQEWIWLLFIVAMPGFGTFWYFFGVYRGTDSATRGFELPGAHSRRRIKELQAQIHHLDKAHHHLALGDIHFQRGKLDLAERSYRASLERDATDRDAQSHLGQCLLRQKKPAEAQPLLEGVVREDSRHDYGYTMMALAETRAALGRIDDAIRTWEDVLQFHSYSRARVQLAELYLSKGEQEKALQQLREVIESEPHAPAFDRKRNRVWLVRAKRLARRAGV